MEKRAFLTAALAVWISAANAAGPEDIPSVPLPVTAAAACDVTKTAAYDELMLVDVRLKEYYINITPEFQFVLPDTSLKINFRQNVADSVLEASTEYNYLANKIRYDIRYSLDFYLTFSANLYDSVSFEQLYQENKYIQRNKGFGFSVASPELFNFLLLRQELKFDNYYFARLDNTFTPDTGNVMVLDSWLEIDLNFCDKKIQAEDRLALNFSKYIPSEMSAYNFLFMNVLLNKKFSLDSGLQAYFRYEGGYLIQKVDLPVWQTYRLGGYERMMGYNYDEFEGHYMNFIRLKLETPVLEKINWEVSWIRFDTLSLFTVFDAGFAGNMHDAACLSSYSYSAGLGIIVEFTFRQRTSVKMTFAVAQAIRQGKLPVFYFVHQF